MTPVIGIVTCGFAGNRQFVTDSYISAVCRAGGCPVLLPCVEEGDRGFMEVMASCCHGFLFCGGGDITPFLLDRPPLSPSGETDIKTDIFQMLFLKYVLATSKPILAICRGMQVLNAACGGETGGICDDHTEQKSLDGRPVHRRAAGRFEWKNHGRASLWYASCG